MAYVGRPAPQFQFDALVKDTFSGNGSTTDFTLSKSPASVNSLLVIVDNVLQEPATAFSVSDTTLSFTEAPSSGSKNIYACFWGGTLGITTAVKLNTSNVAAITGNVTPASNVAFSLGQPANAWKELWLDGNSLHLGNTSMSIGKTGEVEFMKTNKLGQPVTSVDVANVHASIDAGGVLSFYSANTTGNVRFARGAAIGYANSKVPGANLDVKGNAYIGGATTIGGTTTSSGATISGTTTTATTKVTDRLFIGDMTTSIPVSEGQQNWTQSHETSNRGGISLFSTHNSSGGTELVQAKGRSGAIGSFTIVQDDDTLGTLSWCGDDGTNMNSVGARILAAVDGTPGENDMPGRLTFLTTADGSTSPTERVRITSAGYVGIGATAPAALLDVTSGEIRMTTARNIQWGGTNVRIQGTHATNLFEIYTGGTAKMVVKGDDVGIGTSSPATQLNITKSAQAEVRTAGVIGGTGQTTAGTNAYQSTTPQFDFSDAQNWSITLANNVSLANPLNATVGQTGSIFVQQDGTGSRTMSFQKSWIWAADTTPTLTTTASANDRIDYIVQAVHANNMAKGIQAVATLDIK